MVDMNLQFFGGRGASSGIADRSERIQKSVSEIVDRAIKSGVPENRGSIEKSVIEAIAEQNSISLRKARSEFNKFRNKNR